VQAFPSGRPSSGRPDPTPRQYLDLHAGEFGDLRRHAQPGEPERCVALAGRLGGSVFCTLHTPDARPLGCREFQVGEPSCNLARRRHGLARLNADGTLWTRGGAA